MVLRCFRCGGVSEGNLLCVTCESSLYTDTVKLWGEGAQVMMAIEEMAELIDALAKYLRGRRDIASFDVLEEIVDVTLMMEQMRRIFGNDNDYKWLLDNKKRKLVERMKNADTSSL